MKTLVIVGAMVLMAGVTRGVMAGPLAATLPHVTSVSITPSGGILVDDRYLMPRLPDSTMNQLPAQEQTGDRYLDERRALADLIIGERILGAEDLANIYAQDLPGFAAVLQADGFRQDTDGTWFYDPYSSWMRFPLNR